MKCVKCQAETGFEAGARPGRRETCANCGQDIRACVFCEYYDPNAQWECREHIQEPVLEKEKANFCDYFRISGKTSAAGEPKPTPLSAAEKLFKK